MAGIKISDLPAATTPLSGDEQIALVQNSCTKVATVDDICGALSDDFVTKTTYASTSGVYTTVNSNSATWDSVYSSYQTNSADFAQIDQDNTFTGTQNFRQIAAGYCATATDYSASVGGYYNDATGGGSSVAGGYNNDACSSYSFIGGGENNAVAGTHCGAAIIGGSCVTSVSGNMLHAQSLYLQTLPTTYPGVPGVVWNDGNILTTGTGGTITGTKCFTGDAYFTGDVIDFDAGTSLNFAGGSATFDNEVTTNFGLTATDNFHSTGDAFFTGNILSAGSDLNDLFGSGGGGGGDVCTTTENTFTCCTFFNEQTTMRDILSGTQIVVGAYGNSVTGDDSNSNTIIGGRENTIEASGAFHGCSVIAGGNTNIMSCSQNNFIGGGSTNAICTNATQNAIAGGAGARINGNALCSFIGGGQQNSIGTNVRRGALIGGDSLSATADNAVVAGGEANCAYSTNAFIGGGDSNIAGTCAGVIGGCCNRAEGNDGAIIGGASNCISSAHQCSVIAAGTSINSVSGCMLHVDRLYADDLPTSDPGVAGVIWNDSGTLKISV